CGRHTVALAARQFRSSRSPQLPMNCLPVAEVFAALQSVPRSAEPIQRHAAVWLLLTPDALPSAPPGIPVLFSQSVQTRIVTPDSDRLSPAATCSTRGRAFPVERRRLEVVSRGRCVLCRRLPGPL